MLEIRCDFCKKTITTRQNKGGEPKAFRLEENICDACKKADLGKRWEKQHIKIEEEWTKVIHERRKFFEALLKHQEKEFIIQKKKEHFGSFFIEGK